MLISRIAGESHPKALVQRNRWSRERGGRYFIYGNYNAPSYLSYFAYWRYFEGPTDQGNEGSGNEVDSNVFM